MMKYLSLIMGVGTITGVELFSLKGFILYMTIGMSRAMIPILIGFALRKCIKTSEDKSVKY